MVRPRLVSIDSEGAREAYRDMVDFASSIGDERAARQLQQALDGRGAFRRFREGLADFPNLTEPWQTYAQACAERRAIEWLIRSGVVDHDDGETEVAVRSETESVALAEIGKRTGVEIDESAVVERWSEVRRGIESDQEVTVLRDGRPWAIITPP